VNFDQDVKKQVCEVKGDDVILWDSVTRHRDGSLRHVSEACMLDVLHWAAKIGREQNTGAAHDFEALERLRKLAFAETAPAPKIPEQITLVLTPVDDEEPEP